MNGNGEEMQKSSALAANGQQECEYTDTLRVLCMFPSRPLIGFLMVQGIVFPSADSQTQETELNKDNGENKEERPLYLCIIQEGTSPPVYSPKYIGAYKKQTQYNILINENNTIR